MVVLQLGCLQAGAMLAGVFGALSTALWNREGEAPESD